MDKIADGCAMTEQFIDQTLFPTSPPWACVPLPRPGCQKREINKRCGSREEGAWLPWERWQAVWTTCLLNITLALCTSSGTGPSGLMPQVATWLELTQVFAERNNWDCKFPTQARIVRHLLPPFCKSKELLPKCEIVMGHSSVNKFELGKFKCMVKLPKKGEHLEVLFLLNYLRCSTMTKDLFKMLP